MKRTLSFALTAALALSLAVPALAAEESPFADVPPDHWAAGAIRQAYDEGIISGTGYDQESQLAVFAPDAPLTPGQFAVIVAQAFCWREMGQDPDGPLPDGSPWYAPYQRTIERAGLTQGAGIADWEAPMTRYQMAVVLYRLAERRELPLPDAVELAAVRARIGDWDQIPEQYQQAVAACFALGLLSGVDGAGTFAGDQTLIRAQAAAVFSKADKAIEAKDGPMERVLEKAERDAKKANFLATEFTRYPGRLGTAYSVSQGGVPHGGNSFLRYVALDGTELDIRSLLPEGYVYGSYWSLDPADIQLDETGKELSFVTRVREQIVDPAAAGGFREGEDWGDTRIVVDVVSGTVVSMEPLS